jgi:NADP-dependent 3-hydroxy acid dehydrogenase YdfG
MSITGDRKLAIIVGGSSGLGYGMADALIAAEYRVHLIARSTDRLRDAAQRLGPLATWHPADVAVRTEIEAAIHGIDSVDVLINSAGFLHPVALASPADEADRN